MIHNSIHNIFIKGFSLLSLSGNDKHRDCTPAHHFVCNATDKELADITASLASHQNECCTGFIGFTQYLVSGRTIAYFNINFSIGVVLQDFFTFFEALPVDCVKLIEFLRVVGTDSTHRLHVKKSDPLRVFPCNLL